MSDYIRLAHGYGGRLTQELIDGIIYPALSGTHEHPVTLDAAVLESLEPPVVVSTDSFTVSPRFFPGGDIGSLAVHGTVNDVAMMGAQPSFITLGLILEEGLELNILRRVMTSLGNACREAGVQVVSGDTKVVEKGTIDGLFINTTGFGTQTFGNLGPAYIKPGDKILLSGTLGDHGTAILNARESLGFSGGLVSDSAALNGLIRVLAESSGDALHALRDPTRGGMSATLNEFAADTGLMYHIYEDDIPVRPEVRGFTELLGLDVLTLANEGKFIAFVASDAADQALKALHSHPLGTDAAIIGHVEETLNRGTVVLETVIGTKRIIDMPVEEGLPRIC